MPKVYNKRNKDYPKMQSMWENLPSEYGTPSQRIQSEKDPETGLTYYLAVKQEGNLYKYKYWWR